MPHRFIPLLLVAILTCITMPPGARAATNATFQKRIADDTRAFGAQFGISFPLIPDGPGFPVSNACGLTIHSNPANYPYGIYTIPEISFRNCSSRHITSSIP